MEKFLKSRVYQTTLHVSRETYMLVKKQQFKLDLEQWTGSKLGKEYIEAVHCNPAYLIYMQSTSHTHTHTHTKTGWMNHKLESRLLREISTISDMKMTTPLWQKAKKD